MMRLFSLFGMSKERIRRLEQKRNVKRLSKAFHYKVKPDIRLEAVKALGRVGTPAAYSVLLRNCDDELILDAALPILRSIEDVTAMKEAFEIIFNEKNSYIGRIAVKVLGKIGTPVARSLLAPACENSDQDIRNAALDALISGDALGAIPVLLKAIRESKGPDWSTLQSLEKIIETHSETITEARHEIRDAIIPLLRSKKNQGIRTKAASLLNAVGYSPETLADKLLFAIACNDLKLLQSSTANPVGIAVPLYNAGVISEEELDRVHIAFPSKTMVEKFFREKKYSLLGKIREYNTSFDDQIYALIVRRLVVEFVGSDYTNKEIAEALLTLKHPMSADSLRVALDRGIFEWSYDFHDRIRKFVEENINRCGRPEEATCDICHKKKRVKEMSFYTTLAPPDSVKKYQWHWFCKGRCWLIRGEIIGSRRGRGCPFWNDGVCKASDQCNPCSLEEYSYTACFVYKSRQ